MALTTRNREFSEAFSVDETLIDRLQDLTSRPEIGGLTATVDLSDSSTIHNLSTDELRKLPNLRTRQIRRIVLENEYSKPVRMKIDFDSGQFRNLEYRVTGPDEDVLALSTKIDEILSASFSRLSYFQRMPSTHKGGWYISLFILGISFPYLPRLWTNTELSTTVSITLTVLQIGTISFAIFYGRLVKFVLPHEYFAIGDGAHRKANFIGRIRSVRNVIVTVVLLGTLVTIIGNYLTDSFLRR